MPEETQKGNAPEPQPLEPLQSASEIFPPALPSSPGTVALIGRLASLRRGTGLFALESGQARAEAHCTDPALLAFLKEGAWVRAFGKVDAGNQRLEASLVQELKGFDAGQFEKVKALEKKAYPGT